MTGQLQGPDVRRVTVVAINDPQAVLRDGVGKEYRVRVDLRPKGTGLPAAGEQWVIQRSANLTWRLIAQIGHEPLPVVTGSRVASDPLARSLLAALVSLGLVVDGTSP